MKRILLSIVAVIMLTCIKANDTWPITLTKADGLPGKKVSMYMSYSSRLFTFDEPTTKLRITVCETTSTATGNNSSGRISNGPGFPYITLSELRVLNAKGEPISYTITTNAQASNSGLVEDLTDGDTLTYFQSTTGKGTYNGHYHHMELTFEKPISSFSVEWDSHCYMHNTMPEYVGLTPGTDYIPFPEQELSLEKVTSIEQLKDETGLFLLEGHVEAYFHEAYNHTYAGGGFFESPYLATSTPSASGLFTLVPVKGKSNTYKVSYFNHERYITKMKSAGSVQWTNIEASSEEITFTQLADGTFELTAADGNFIFVEDAYMRLNTLVNSDDGKSSSKRPYSSKFTIHKANISGASIVNRIQKIIDEAERRIGMYHKYMADEQTLENNLKKSIESAKNQMINPPLTYQEYAKFAAEFNNQLNEYVSTYTYQFVDSIMYICDCLAQKELPTSRESDWKLGTFPDTYANYLELLAIDISDKVINCTYLNELDEMIEVLTNTLDNFWASRISCIATLPFKVGATNDGLPGTLQSNGSYLWKSPIYYLEKPVKELRFTVLKTNNGESYLGYDIPAIAEFGIYDKFGRKVNLTEDMISVNSLTTFGGSTIAKMIDGQINTYYCGALPDKVDVYGYANDPQYCYIDVKLPEEMEAFSYSQQGYSVGTRVPVVFTLSQYGKKVEPETINFLDANKITEGTYVIESAFDGFLENGNPKMAICCAKNENADLNSNYTFKWEASPMSGIGIDSAFCFQLIYAGKADDDSKESYYIKNAATGEYLGFSETVNTPIASTLERAATFTISYRGNASFEIASTADANKALCISNHQDGAANKGDVVYNTYAEKYSRWNLRLLNSNPTAIASPVTEGDEIVSVNYYTPAGISVKAPVKGMNIVKYVYANGVIKSEKIYK